MRKFIITVNGQQYDVEVEEVKNVRNAGPVSSGTVAAKAPAAAASAPAASATNGSVKVNAPMPGSILKINVNTGDMVKRGDSLLILEAMKMENEIVAPEDGKIATIKVTKGQSVNLAQTLIEMI